MLLTKIWGQWLLRIPQFFLLVIITYSVAFFHLFKCRARRIRHLRVSMISCHHRGFQELLENFSILFQTFENLLWFALLLYQQWLWLQHHYQLHGDIVHYP